MRIAFRRAVFVLGFFLCFAPVTRIVASAAQSDDVLLASMQQELQRARDNLGKLDPAPYFLSYSVYDQSEAVAVATDGSLMTSAGARRRSADVIVRVGTAALDNAHEQNRYSAIDAGVLPLADDRNALSHALWQLTYQEYRKAAAAFLNVKTSNQVHAQEEDTSPDFSQEKPQTHLDYGGARPQPEQPVIEKLVRQYSSCFRKYPYIYKPQSR